MQINIKDGPQRARALKARSCRSLIYDVNRLKSLRLSSGQTLSLRQEAEVTRAAGIARWGSRKRLRTRRGKRGFSRGRFARGLIWSRLGRSPPRCILKVAVPPVVKSARSPISRDLFPLATAISLPPAAASASSRWSPEGTTENDGVGRELRDRGTSSSARNFNFSRLCESLGSRAAPRRAVTVATPPSSSPPTAEKCVRALIYIPETFRCDVAYV